MSGLPVGTVLDADLMPEPRDGTEPLDDAALLSEAPTAVPGRTPACSLSSMTGASVAARR